MSEITSKLIERVEKAIQDNKDFKPSWKVDVIEQDTVITLEGVVPSHTAKDTVEKIVRHQPGVSGVINNLDINKPDEGPIDELDIDSTLKNPPSQHISLGK